MRRRLFIKAVSAAGLSATLPACGRDQAGKPPSLPSRISAISGDGKPLEIETAAVAELAESLSGALYLPTDTGYDAARQVWNGMIRKRPAMVASCTSASDVQNCVTFARERGLLLAVKCGGHSYPGKSTCDDGMMIDLSPMHAVAIDADACTATVQGGALLGHLDTASLARGLVTTAGIVSHTGVGGFTLGGGMGRLDRKLGLAIDNLLSATVVTADGQLRRASEDENPDLYWALRGGGGNFGVVTEFVYSLHPFDDTVYGGHITYPIEQARKMMTTFAELEQTMPDAINAEPYLFVEDGKRMLGFGILYAGAPADGEKVLQPLLAARKPDFNSLKPDSYARWQTSADEYLGHGKLNYLKSGFIVEMTPAFIDAFVGNYEGDVLPNVWYQHLGGATSRVASDATAYAHRDVRFNLGIDAVFTDATETDAQVGSVRRYYEAMEPYMKGYYTNLNEEGVEKTWGNYGPNYPRLSALKAKYDANNLFRLNANIQPSG